MATGNWLSWQQLGNRPLNRKGEGMLDFRLAIFWKVFLLQSQTHN
jgi:hypothetical protein